MTEDVQLLRQMVSRSKSVYYDREGKPLELLEWCKLCEDEEYVTVKKEQVGKYLISTVWIGLNMNIFKDPIQIFETMIFSDKQDVLDPGDSLYGYQERYSTLQEALSGHQKAIKAAEIQVFQEAESAKDSQPEVSGQPQ